MVVSDKEKMKFDNINSVLRFFKLMFISNKNLFILAGNLDTYIYLLFLRIAVYYSFILMVVNCGVLLPIYANGNTIDIY
jgi:hypothetical protein